MVALKAGCCTLLLRNINVHVQCMSISAFIIMFVYRLVALDLLCEYSVLIVHMYVHVLALSD